MFMKQQFMAGLIAIIIIISISGCTDKNASEPLPDIAETVVHEKLNKSNVTTTWDLSFLFCNREEVMSEFEVIKLRSDELTLRSEEIRLRTEYIDETYRPKFRILTGSVLLQYLEDEKAFYKSLEVIWLYAFAHHSLNVNDEFFETLLADLQDLHTEHEKATSFVTLKLSSISKPEWAKIFEEEPGLKNYRRHLESRYIRYADHGPQNETHAAFLASIGNQHMKFVTKAIKEITNNVSKAGNITLDSGVDYAITLQSYESLLSTDTNRTNRARCYDKMFYHLINESDKMAELYREKAKLDDLCARERNYTDAYEAKMFCSYLTREQIGDMNSVFKERKDVFDGYYEFMKNKLELNELRPYDLYLQLMADPDQKYNYTDALIEIQESYSQMDPVFNDIFIETVTGNFTDVYPESGKLPGCYCLPICALQSPSLMLMNYQGLIQDKKVITHEFGHVINFYLMSNNVDYLYCWCNMYEIEIPSTFNEELYVDYILGNYDEETAVAVLAQHIGEYHDNFPLSSLSTEFEYEAHKLCARQDIIRGSDLNALWSNLSKEYRSDLIVYHDEDSAEWICSRIYLYNYKTLNLAVSRAITLSLFKKYKEDPEEFNKNYIEYLSVGTTITPAEKLKKYFGIEVNKKLFEDAMDVVESRVEELYLFL